MPRPRRDGALNPESGTEGLDENFGESSVVAEPELEPEPDEGPERRCVVTGERGPKDGLIRFVIGPDGAVVPDLVERLPGRGIWLTASRSVLRMAISKRGFARAARRPVGVPDELADLVERGLATRLIDGLGLARRAGIAVTGFEKTAAALAGGDVALVFTASDGAEGGRRKLLGGREDLAVCECLSASELGRAFGRDRAVHAAVSGRRSASSNDRSADRTVGKSKGAAGRDGLIARLVRDVERLRGFRDSPV